jgi:hypothetical protein
MPRALDEASWPPLHTLQFLADLARSSAGVRAGSKLNFDPDRNVNELDATFARLSC